MESPNWRDEPNINDLMLKVANTDNVVELKLLLAIHTKKNHRGVIRRTCHPCMIITQKILALEENKRKKV